jgi:hypothetical protein
MVTKEDGEVIGEAPGVVGSFPRRLPGACFPPLTSSYTRTGILVAVLRTPWLARKSGGLARGCRLPPQVPP